VEQSLALAVRAAPWLSFQFELDGSGATGTGPSGLVLRGLSYAADGELSALFGLWRSDSPGAQASLRLGAGASRGRTLSLVPVAQSAVLAPITTLDEVAEGGLRELLFIPEEEERLVGALHGALAMGRVVGLQGSVTGERAWRRQKPFDVGVDARRIEPVDAMTLSLAGALDADFSSLGVPLGVIGEYRYRLGSESHTGFSRDTESSALAAGLYFTGRPELELGLGVIWAPVAERVLGLDADGALTESGAPWLARGLLHFRYVW